MLKQLLDALGNLLMVCHEVPADQRQMLGMEKSVEEANAAYLNASPGAEKMDAIEAAFYLAVEMRALQAAYFDNRTTDNLNAAKAAERAFDKVAQAITAPNPEQKSLF